MASRNTFRRGGTPLRTIQLSDPFATMVANLNQQLGFLQEQKALAALATGDPDTFLALAGPLLAKKEGQERAVWEGLIHKAEKKIDDSKWATGISEGSVTLEDFYNHLWDTLDQTPEGTQEAYDIIANIDGVKKAISARDEGISDQKALQEYIKTNDHKAYADYWIQKLQRTSDPATFDKIRAKIEELRARDQTEKQVKRIQDRMQVMDGYLNGGVSAAKTVALLQSLALDKDVTAPEVSSLQTLVQQIHDREESAARSAGASAKASYGLDIPELQRNIDFYKEVRGKVDQALKDGADPAKIPGLRPNTTLLDDLRAAASILTGQYKAASENAAGQRLLDKAEEFATTAQAIQTHLGDIPNRIDANTLKNSVKLTADEFKTALGAMTPEQRVDARVSRLAALSRIYNGLQTPGAKASVQSDMNGLAADEQRDIATVANTDSLTAGDKRDLQNAYKRYTDLGGKMPYEQFLKAADEVGKSGLTGTELSQAFADKTGLKLQPMVTVGDKTFGTNDYFVGQTDQTTPASSIVSAIAGLAKNSTLLENQDRASEMFKKWLAIPGAMPFGDPGTMENSLLGLTANDIVELRRGAGLIGPQQAGFSTGGATSSVANPEDLTGYPSSDQELRQERAMQREAQRKVQTEMAPSIEDTLLNTTPPPVQLPSTFDPGAVQEPDRYSGMDDTWANALKFLDSPTVLDVPGFQIPNTPDSYPFANLPQFDAGTTSGPMPWDIPTRDAHDYMDSRRGANVTPDLPVPDHYGGWDQERGLGPYAQENLGNAPYGDAPRGSKGY